jgi:hypothetical protein
MMRPEMPAPAGETGNAEGVRTSDGALTPKPAPQVPRRPLRLIHLMALVAALALTLVVPPSLIPLIQEGLSGWDYRDQLVYKTTLALIFWTPIVALMAVIVAIRTRSRLGRVGRSYGTAAVFAAAAAIFLLVVRGLSSSLIAWYLQGFSFFPEPDSYFSPTARRLAMDAPAATAAATVAVWLILALNGAGRRPADWFDRFCLLFGLLWVLWYLRRDLMLDLMLHIPWLW